MHKISIHKGQFNVFSSTSCHLYIHKCFKLGFGVDHNSVFRVCSRWSGNELLEALTRKWISQGPCVVIHISSPFHSSFCPISSGGFVTSPECWKFCLLSTQTERRKLSVQETQKCRIVFQQDVVGGQSSDSQKYLTTIWLKKPFEYPLD